MMPKKERLERREYPNRARLRQMYDARYNRKLTYDQFRDAVKRDIDLNNKKYEAEQEMNKRMNEAKPIEITVKESVKT